MRTRIAVLGTEDRKEFLRLFMLSELIRCGSVQFSREEALQILHDERDFFEYVAEAYDIDDEEGFEIDPVFCAAYRGVE